MSGVPGSTTITAGGFNGGQIQVSPTTATVTGSGSANFTITVKKQGGSVTFTSSPGCDGPKAVSITIK
jgi:hypothetical protein